MMSWGDATGYLGDYMCMLSTEYALLTKQGKNTTATLNELYYAINAIDRLDGIAEKTFNNNIINNNYNGFFLRDDVTESLSIDGKVTSTYDLPTNATDYLINNLELENGLYLCRIIGDGKTITTKKFIISNK